jgi:hypothetical protein
MAADRVNELMRRGLFSRRQAALLSTLGEGSGPSDSLMLDYDGRNDGGFGLTWSPGWVASDNLWKSFDNSWIPWQPDRLTGSAISYDPESGIVYNNGGVYLNHVYVRFVPDSPAGGPGFSASRTGVSIVSISDSSALGGLVTHPSNTLPPGIDVTWMAFQEDGDTNSTPYLDRVLAPNAGKVEFARYQSVRLLA